jgi:hypothetical protein
MRTAVSENSLILKNNFRISTDFSGSRLPVGSSANNIWG